MPTRSSASRRLPCPISSSRKCRGWSPYSGVR
jgi:hypothetical protein